MGEWDEHHGTLTSPKPYGDPQTYVLAAWWLNSASCATVEDWGCGGGGMHPYLQGVGQYTGIDSSHSPFADRVADLRDYQSRAEGIVIRHVLEHNYDWARILDNAVASFTRRLAVALFTPWVGSTRVLNTEPDYGDRPVIAFTRDDILEPLRIPGVVTDVVRVESPYSHYGAETLVLAQHV